MSWFDDLGSFLVSFFYELFKKGYLMLVIIGLIVLLVWLIRR
jgi:hypothetical protein